ncbi:MAG: hypothetical protein ABI175_10025, partial [Polyangiales bacterium]
MPTASRRNGRRSFALLSILALGLGACAGNAGQPPPGGPPASSTQPKIAIAAPTPEDRTPVDAPDGLAVQLHVAAPKLVVRNLKGYLPSFAGKLDARAVAADLLDAPILAQLIDIGLPVDAALLVR